MIEFFQKLNDKKVFDNVKSINNTLGAIYAVEKKEAVEEKKEREKEDRNRRLEARKKKREKADKGPLWKMFTDDKKKTTKTISLLLLGILGVGAAVIFRKQIGDYIKKKVVELKEDLQGKIDDGVADITKAVSDWARQKFTIDKDKSILEKASKYEGNTVEEKVASIQAERQSLDPVTGMIRDGEYNEMIRVLRTGESRRREGDNTNAAGGGNTGVAGIVSGDIRKFRQSVMGSDKTTLKVVDTLMKDVEKRNEHNDKLAKLRETLEGETDPQERLKLIDLIVEQANAMAKTQAAIKKVFESNKELKEAALNARDERYETMGITPPARFQSGGMVTGGAKSPQQASVKDARLLTTSDFVKAKKPLQKLQSGGLVLFQGHGDVPAGHSAPGTDGPGTEMQGKYKPTAEQYWVNEVAQRAEKLAAQEGVDLKYQRPTGKYASASNPKSNWSMANKLRREGQAAVELHFDAWGYDNGKYVEGKRGMLTSGSALLPAEQNLSNIFGTHPMSGNGWGTMMLELDPLKYATSRTDQYARMLVDAAKGTGKSDYQEAPSEFGDGVDLNTDSDQQQSPNQQQAPNQQSLSSIFGPGLGTFFTTFISGIAEFAGDGIGDLLKGMFGSGGEQAGGFAALFGGDAGSLFGGGEQQQQDGETPNAPTSSGPISGDMKNKAVTIAKRLMEDQGISAAAAAGVVGNLMLESGLQPDNVENGKGFSDGAINNVPAGTKRVGYGYGQWTNDRLEKFRGWLADRGKADAPATDEDNYQYLLHELNSSEPLRGHWKGWGGADIPQDDPAKAATWFMMNWERPGVPHQDRRQGYATQVYDELKAQGLQQGGIVGKAAQSVNMASLPSFNMPSTTASPAMGVGKSMLSPGGMGHSTPGSSNVGGMGSSTAALQPAANDLLAIVLEKQENINRRPKKKTKVAIVNKPSGQQAPIPQVSAQPIPSMGSGRGLNIVETRRKVHRVNSGALF